METYCGNTNKGVPGENGCERYRQIDRLKLTSQTKLEMVLKCYNIDKSTHS